MHVVSGLRTDLREQRAVDPVYGRSVQFSRSAKHSAVVFQFRNENILDLQISARMQ